MHTLRAWSAYRELTAKLLPIVREILGDLWNLDRRAGKAFGRSVAREAAQTRLVAYDRSGDDRYDLLSAFHKSLRGSDADAALFWMALV